MQRPILLLYLATLTLNVGVALIFGYSAAITTYYSDKNWQLITLVSTHFTHHSYQHLVGNMLALGLLLYLFPGKIKTIIWAFISCVLMVAVYAKVLNIYTYLGFSAMLYCLPGNYFCFLIKSKKVHQSATILMILVIYLFMISPMRYNNTSAWHPMTSAHLIGFLCGCLVHYLGSIKPFSNSHPKPLSKPNKA
ncbi:MAG: rhomboid family intramembrane serine protease [Marinicella sp.]